VYRAIYLTLVIGLVEGVGNGSIVDKLKDDPQRTHRTTTARSR
jgi:hypothetical protein